jgi:hypothetical protein
VDGPGFQEPAIEVDDGTAPVPPEPQVADKYKTVPKKFRPAA